MSNNYVKENVSIDYRIKTLPNFKNDVAAATEHFLRIEHSFELVPNLAGETTWRGKGFILNPSALNPFLKVAEIMKNADRILILPIIDDRNTSPEKSFVYLILKFPDGVHIREMNLEHKHLAEF